MMGRIYGQACTVLVHIPDTEQGSSDVKALVEDIKDIGLEEMYNCVLFASELIELFS